MGWGMSLSQKLTANMDDVAQDEVNADVVENE